MDGFHMTIPNHGKGKMIPIQYHHHLLSIIAKEFHGPQPQKSMKNKFKKELLKSHFPMCH